ncbi:MAG: hypothetical protein KF851_14855 [Pirellulaceae bacterium]|nr:hypothetical protein [Pirellulaceae bacterium]
MTAQTDTFGDSTRMGYDGAGDFCLRSYTLKNK